MLKTVLKWFRKKLLESGSNVYVSVLRRPQTAFGQRCLHRYHRGKKFERFFCVTECGAMIDLQGGKRVIGTS